MPTIHVQMSITLGENDAKAVAEILGPAFRKAMVSPGREFDERRETYRPEAPAVTNDGKSKPGDQTLLVDTKHAARLLKVSPRKLWEMYNSGAMPQPVRLGSLVRWSLDTLKKWVDEGCPSCR